MRFRTLLTYLSLLPLGACTRSCNEYDNNEEFARATLPAYTETGTGTLGCVLGSQTWTVLGSFYQNRFGYPWQPNTLLVESSYSVPRYVVATGRMTGVRNSQPFYDRQLFLTLLPSDTLGGLHLLGNSPAPGSAGPDVEQVRVNDFITDTDYRSTDRHPVRLLVRKLDRQQRIISGTFTGSVYGGPSGHDSLALADGRFDFRY